MTPFLGVSSERLMELIEKICLEFVSYKKGETIIYPGMEAKRLLLLLNGSVLMERELVSEVKVSWHQKVFHPIDMPALFSLSLRHAVKAIALDKVNLISIDRDDFRRMYETEPIILMNLLNTLGRAASLYLPAEFSNLVEYWLVDLANVESAGPVRVDSNLKRIGELLSLPVNDVASLMDELERKGVVKWLRDEHAVLIRDRKAIDS